MAKPRVIASFNTRMHGITTDSTLRVVSDNPDVMQTFVVEVRAQDALGTETWERVEAVSTSDASNSVARMTRRTLANMLAAMSLRP